jgi:hypothetical protein
MRRLKAFASSVFAWIHEGRSMRFATLERPVVIAMRIADCSGGVIMPVGQLCPAGLRRIR